MIDSRARDEAHLRRNSRPTGLPVETRARSRTRLDSPATAAMLALMSANDAAARAAIENLIYSYAERLDLGDFDGVGELFANADYGPADVTPVHGAGPVTQLLRASVQLHGDSPATKHVTTNVIVELEGEHADARSYFSVFQAVGSAAPVVIVQGRYHDRFVLEAGRWRFERRTIYMDALGDVSRHLTFDVSEFVGR